MLGQAVSWQRKKQRIKPQAESVSERFVARTNLLLKTARALEMNCSEKCQEL